MILCWHIDHIPILKKSCCRDSVDCYSVSEWYKGQSGYYITIYKKIFFRRSIFLYSPCPNLEGIKDALFYKFTKLRIGQKCRAMCTNKVAIETHSRMRGAKRRAFGRPTEQVTKPRVKREARWTALCRTC